MMLLHKKANMSDMHQEVFYTSNATFAENELLDSIIAASRSLFNENMEALPENDQDPNEGGQNKKCFHRHTPEQIQKMEALFRKSPHAGEKERKELAHELGLDPLRVKYWFQNKHTQIRSRIKRNENTELRVVNEKLRVENNLLKETLSSASCPKCKSTVALGKVSTDMKHLLMENAHLKGKIDRMTMQIGNHLSGDMLSFPHPHGIPPPSW